MGKTTEKHDDPKWAKAPKGCPFTGFGPCVEGECVFFVPLSDRMEFAGCGLRIIIINSEFDALIGGLRRFRTLQNGDEIDSFDAEAFGLTLSVEHVLEKLEAFYNRTDVEPGIRARLDIVRVSLRAALRRFAEGRDD